MKDPRFLQVVGWTLIVAAVLMHFSVCEWDSTTRNSQIIWFVHAREQFIEHDHFGNPTDKYNIFGAGFWGLVIPVCIAGSGIAIINRTMTPKE
jgi:hypothetical protein